MNCLAVAWSAIVDVYRCLRGFLVANAPVVSFLLAGISALAAWLGLRQAVALFRLQRRPWLRLTPCEKFNVGPVDQKLTGTLRVCNYGLGGAWRCRVHVVIDRNMKSAFGGRPVWADAEVTVHGTSVQELVVPPGEETPSYEYQRPLAGILVPGTPQMLHFCCDYRGTETRERYYTEEVHKFTVSVVPPSEGQTAQVTTAPMISYLGKIGRRGSVRLA